MKFLVLFALVAGAFASVENCPANSHFEECGTACPTTCKNYENPPKVCVLLCVPGCFCDEGYVETEDGRCVKPERCSIEDVWESDSDLCSQPAETGLCRGYFPRYHFDKEAGQCKKFVYGGCGGNENNFKTVEECASACGNQADAVCGENERFNGCGTACPLTCENYDNPPKFCVLMCKIGCECEKGFVRRADGKCVKPEQCPNRQALHAKTRNACEEDKEVGPCKAAFARFYFNKKTGQCEPFIYGGCDGNSNNFLTQDDCEDVCIY